MSDLRTICFLIFMRSIGRVGARQVRSRRKKRKVHNVIGIDNLERHSCRLREEMPDNATREGKEEEKRKKKGEEKNIRKVRRKRAGSGLMWG